ncbi:MAG: hypothetical protein JWM53_2737, partial [bacterium]|nr:hypothetical protein [bacterium]
MTLRCVTLSLVVAVGAGCHPRATNTAADLAALPSENSDLDSGAAGDLASRDDAGSQPTVDWSKQVIYLALVDRFANGS